MIKIRVQLLVAMGMLIIVAGCSHTVTTKKNLIDSSGSRPSWVSSQKTSWEEGDAIYFKSKVSLKGKERENAGYIIAGNDNRENLLRSISDQIKGATDEAQMSLDENSEIVLGKVRSGRWEGTIYGLINTEQYNERFEYCRGSECTQRLDCYILSSISRADYNKTKDGILNQIIAIDPKIKGSIIRKQAAFFALPNEKQAELNGKSSESQETPKPSDSPKQDQ
ncbi:MAG: hypothetical protein ACLQDF_05860 [Desulfomonilia bacterium]